jgi:hypothetical protein
LSYKRGDIVAFDNIDNATACAMTNEEVRAMKRKIASFVSRVAGDESGAVIALVAIAIVALIGLGALALDVGNIAWAQLRLQATTDLAAISGAAKLSCTACSGSTVTAAATSYSAGSGENNVQRGITVTMVSGYPKLVCLTTIGSYNSATEQCLGAGSCTAAGASTSGGCNAIEVQQQTTVAFSLGQIFGLGSVTLTATSWAAEGGAMPPLHIMMVLDNTTSMSNSDPTAPSSGPQSCGNIAHPTRLDCALAGLQTMLAELWPTQDQVGLIVFPPVSTSNYGNDYNCSSSAGITPEPYSSYPSSSVYQITTLTSGYKSNNTSSLSSTSSSALITATCQSGMTVTDPVDGVVSNCGSCTGDKAPGGEGTYLAGAITAAQNTLNANTVSGVQNVIIVLSDGGAGNASTLYSGNTTAATTTTKNNTVLNIAVPTNTVIPGTSVADTSTTSAIPAGTLVVSTTATTVTISTPVTATVKSGDHITFGTANQCHEAIVAAQDAASQGTWVYSIAYQSYLQLSPNTNSCSDTETPPISSCTTMQDIANSPGAVPGTYFQDNSRFYSDPMGLTSPNGPCVSPANPNATSMYSIFTNLGFQFAALIPIGTN